MIGKRKQAEGVGISLLLIGIPIGLVLLFLYFVVDPVVILVKRDERTVAEAIEQIPAEPFFYVMVATVVGLRMWWMWWNSIKVSNDTRRRMRADRARQLKNREWWLVRDLRKRALGLRARADLIFGGGFLALMAGIYGVAFILPEISVRDHGRISLGLFKSEFGSELGCVIEGKCMVKLVSKFPIDTLVEEGLQVNGQAVTSSRKTDGRAEIAYSTRISGINLRDEQVKFEHESKLRIDGRSPEMNISMDGSFGIIVGGEDSVWVTGDSGKSWNQKNLKLRAAEYVKAIAIGKKSTFGTVVGDEGSIWVTRDRGENWKQFTLELPSREYITELAMGEEGGFGMVGSDQGSIWTTVDQGENWRKSTFALGRGEKITTMAVSGKDGFGIIAGDNGSIWMTGDGGETWNKPALALRPREDVTAMAVAGNGGLAIITGDQESVWMTRDRGMTWSEVALGLLLEKTIISAEIDQKGEFAIIVENGGVAWLTRDGGKTWRRLGLKHTSGIRLMGFALDSETELGVFLGLKPYLRTEFRDVVEWHEIEELKFGDQLSETTFSGDGSSGIVGDNKGRIWMMHDRGRRISRLALTVKRGEWLDKGAFDADGEFGIAVGDEGSVWVTHDRGKRWSPVFIELKKKEDLKSAVIYEKAGNQETDEDSEKKLNGKNEEMAVIDTSSAMFVIKKYSKLNSWRTWSLDKIQNEMGADYILRKSELFRGVSDYVESTRQAFRGSGAGNEANGEGGDSKLFGGMLDHLTIVRVSTLAVMFFFVQMLIRLYQYNLRLAAFWDSRADAMLLAHSFAVGGIVRFDDLVGAMAPDSYDFKAPPRSPLDGIWPRRRR